MIPITKVEVNFNCITSNGVTLELDGDNKAFLYGGQLIFNDDDMLTKHSYVLTKKDGTKLYLNEEYGLTKIEDSNGNTITLSSKGIFHSEGNSIYLVRDEKGRITNASERNAQGTTIFYVK